MKPREVVIAGLGISGSMAALQLSRQGAAVKGVDPNKIYPKPCGDAVTLRPWIKSFLEEMDVIVTGVKEYSIYIDNILIHNIVFNKYNWYIINKQKLIEKMRKEAVREGAKIIRGYLKEPCNCDGKECLCIDARGPYAHSKDKWVLTTRIIARAREKWNPEHAILEFLPDEKGLFWLFPASDDGKIINFGIGWINNNDIINAKTTSITRAKKIVGPIEILDVKAAPIALTSSINIGNNNLIKIGEAAGLIISSAGEGNRPGLESALILSNSYKKENIFNSYKNNIKHLISEAKASRLALYMTIKMPHLFKKVMFNIDKNFWINYLQAKIEMKNAIKYIINIPLYIKR